MNSQLSINFSDKIESVTILDTCPASIGSESQLNGTGNDISGQSQANGISSDAQTAALIQTSRALSCAAEKLQKLYEQVVAQHREEIARLSIEIARKILMHKVETKDYEIESIVKEVLKKSPSHQDIVIHLNPEDLTQCDKIQNDEIKGLLASVKLIADPNIGLAECILKSPKGTINLLINEHLEQIGEALRKAQ